MSKRFEVTQKGDVVTVRDLQMVYRVGKIEVPALRGVDTLIKEGEFVAVMGPSGCGKSTLLHLVGGLLKPTSGRIFIDGIDISSVSDAVRTEIRRRKMGFVFQQYNLLPTLTAKDNIELAKRIHGNDHYEQGSTRHVLRMLGLENKMHHKPSELSGGEQQRVAIARALISRPSILLADEPTGNLDSDNSRIVLDMLKELNLKYAQTIIMVTHNPEAASTANRIIEMRDGKIVNPVQNLFYAMEEKRF
ncbi:ABC transporter ATP-binding protein [Acidobacteria bacterium AH-259-G07]|nr:ABC transporter ATP-binding protein [Acidobacteria bacterium AH-259-G07]